MSATTFYDPERAEWVAFADQSGLEVRVKVEAPAGRPLLPGYDGDMARLRAARRLAEALAGAALPASCCQAWKGGHGTYYARAAAGEPIVQTAGAGSELGGFLAAWLGLRDQLAPRAARHVGQGGGERPERPAPLTSGRFPVGSGHR